MSRATAHLSPALGLLALMLCGCRPGGAPRPVARTPQAGDTALRDTYAEKARLEADLHAVRGERAALSLEAGLLRQEVEMARARAAESERERGQWTQEKEETARRIAELEARLTAAEAMAAPAEDWFLFKNGRAFGGRLVEVTDAEIALETAPGAVVRGPLSAVRKITPRSGPPAEATASTPPATASAPPPSAPAPVTPAPAAPAVVTSASALASPPPAGPTPRLRIDVIKRKNQKTSETTKSYAERLQVVELEFGITNLDLAQPATNLQARVWVVAQNVEDADEMRLISVETHPFSLKPGGVWEFATNQKKLEHVRSSSLVYRRGLRFYGYLLEISDASGRVVAGKASPERLEKDSERLRAQKENAVFRI